MRNTLRRVTLSIAFAGTLAVGPATAQAQVSQVTCFQNYISCVDRASQLAGFWQRTAAGADCYVSLLACIARAFHP